MNKELDFIELNFAKVVAEPMLLDALSQILGLNRAAMWNWNWPGQAPEHVQTNVTYVVDNDSAYPLFISLGFNQTLIVRPAFEVVAGYELAGKFDCAVLVNDPRDEADSLLEVRPTGQVVACGSEIDEGGRSIYIYPPHQDVTYQDVVSEMENRTHEAA